MSPLVGLLTGIGTVLFIIFFLVIFSIVWLVTISSIIFDPFLIIVLAIVVGFMYLVNKKNNLKPKYAKI